jgi:DASH complex subunit ASK1
MPNEDTTTTDHEQTVTEDSTNMTQTSLDDEAASFQTPSSEHLDLGHHHHDESELDISSLTISPSHSTPRPQAYLKGGETPTAVGYPSAYGEDETSRVEYEESTLPNNNNANTPVTPGRHTSRFQPNTSGTPMSSPFIPPPTISRTTQLSTSKKTTQKSYQKPTDPVLHHVLDKTYRVQATPLSKGYKPTKFSVNTPKENPTDSKHAYDDSPLSSPELEAPKLRSELFAYRGGGQNTPGTNRKTRRSPQKRERTTPRPGVSVLTPAKPRLSLAGKKTITTSGGWESDDEDFDDYDPEDTAAALGFSPPKTMQFHIPHSRLMKTPGKFPLPHSPSGLQGEQN